MTRFLIVRLITIQILVISSFAYAGENRNDVLVYYKPFNIDTFVPVTMKNIDEKAHCKLSFPASSDVVKALSYLITSADNGEFSDMLVRLKVSSADGVNMFVEQDGSVFFSDSNRTGRLSPENFIVLRALMESIALAFDCRYL